MAKLPHQLLAQALGRASKVSQQGIVYTKDLSVFDRKRLEKGGWLTRIIRGWYLLNKPTGAIGDTTPWYSSFWNFIALYLRVRFKDKYCLSANESLSLHLGNTLIPKQLLVMVKKGGSSVVPLLFDTSLLIYQENKTFPEKMEKIQGINVMPLASALYRSPPRFFQQQPEEAEIALKLVDLNTLSLELLSGNNLASAERIIGAYQFLRENERAQQLSLSLNSAGYQINPVNPFLIQKPLLSPQRLLSPYAARIKIMWQKMRTDVLVLFPKSPGSVKISTKYFSRLEKIYLHDAYNSLSIEGYQVSEKLIAQIAEGRWDPENALDDKNERNAMAAKGYYEAFNRVKRSIKRIFEGGNAGIVVKQDLPIWYAALFSPSVQAGILKPQHLAGYRTEQVYIRNSMHTPLPKTALVDAMDTLFDCLIEEPEAAVRAVLGHFIFVFIHPYMDGNGRIGRFMMNALLASGGFPWTIVHVAHRKSYFHALEKASTEQDIKPFARFILRELKDTKNLELG